MPDNLKSAVLEDEQLSQEVPTPNYSTEQVLYLSGLQKRLENSRDDRDTAHDEWDGMDYITRYEDEERLANSEIPPRNNKTDTNFISGTIRHKMLALLSAINALNLEPEYSAYDKNDVEVDELGNALEIVRKKAMDMDGDEEKRMMRQMELLKHGHVFVEKIWKVEYKKVKKLNKEFDGSVSGISWKEKLEKTYEGLCGHVLDGRSVYLGDITQPFINKQPYIFTIDDMTYEEAKSVYGEWEMFKYVPKKLKNFNSQTNASSGMAYGNWQLLKGSDKDRVEIVKYQDVYNNEFQILLNGIPMLPVGFPMPWKHKGYNITQQNLEYIHSHFAYGRSFVSRLKVQAALLDEMLRLIILKTQKSFMPPRANNTGRVISKNVFMPGSITMGLNPDQLRPLSEKDGEGLLRGELDTLKLISESIDQNSVSPSFAGQQVKGNPTATEILELQRQAKMILGLSVFSMAMLEKKLGDLDRDILLENWFNPIDTEVDEARKMLVNRYRVANVKMNVDDQGMGNMMVVPTEDEGMFPTGEEAQEMMGEQIYKEEETYQQPTRKIYINVKALRSAELTWKTTVNPTETSGSERSKQLFERMIQSATALGLPINPDYIGQRFAETWQENPNKLFIKPQMGEVVAPGINPGGMARPEGMMPKGPQPAGA